MSNEKLPAPITDLTSTDLAKIEEYRNNGLPRIGEVRDDQMTKMLELYLTGSSYTQISRILGIKRVIVTYLAHTSDWFSMREEYLNELQEKMKANVVDAKLRNAEFMLLAIQAWQKRIAGNLTKYLSTNDTQHMDKVSVKEMALLMKAMEMINDWDSEKSKGKGPAIGLNLGNGIVVEKGSDNKVTITPKEVTVGSLLKRYKALREENSNKTSDINKGNDGEDNEQE